MFESQYYCLVAGLKEYTLDSEAKGFDAKAIVEEILEEISRGDAALVRLLYGYYDCENLAAARAHRKAHNPLGNLSREQIEEELLSPSLSPKKVAKVICAFASDESEEREEVDTSLGFERALFGAYYEECAASNSFFLRSWAETDRNLRNVAAAISARSLDFDIQDVVVGAGDVVDQLCSSSAADFGLRGELPYIDAVIVAVSDEPNIVEKEHKIDNIKWAEVEDHSAADYFNMNAILAYLVKINIVARWLLLDESRGREMLNTLMEELSGKDKINKQ